MTPAEATAAELLATRVAGGLNQMTQEQRAIFMGLLLCQFCQYCGADKPKLCRCDNAAGLS